MISIGKILRSDLVKSIDKFFLGLRKCSCQTEELNLLGVQFRLDSFERILVAHNCEHFQFLSEWTMLYEIESALLTNQGNYLRDKDLSLRIEILSRNVFLTQIGHR